MFKPGDRIKTLVYVNEHRPGIVGTIVSVSNKYKHIQELRMLTDCGKTFGLFSNHVSKEN